ncbi:MAG: acyl-CoA thioesterase [Planctomycetota bacterium]
METPDVPASTQLRFRARVRTRWCDEDVQRVVNNAVYLTLLEEARFAYFDHLGLMEGRYFPFVLAQTNVLFVAPSLGNRDVDVEMATVSIGRTSFEQVYRVRDVASGRILCEARARLVGWDTERSEKRVLDEKFRAAVWGCEGRELGGS